MCRSAGALDRIFDPLPTRYRVGSVIPPFGLVSRAITRICVGPRFLSVWVR